MCLAPKFLLVDDHALYLTGLRLMLADAWPNAELDVATTWEEADEAVSREEWDLVLLDVFLPDAQSLTALPMWLQSKPHLAVMAMSADDSATLRQQARDAGAMGFVHKSATPQTVNDTVRQVLMHGPLWEDEHPKPTTNAWSNWLPLNNDEAPLVSEPATLSDLQLQILVALRDGASLQQMAQVCQLTEDAVRGELSWATEKLGARSRREAIAEAERLGLISPR